ncbi:MAG: hypothetical protein N3A58_08185 [Spirochaetes bacterium]|nr:hypothetical protein [Spirochaetota bacterium]
MKNLIVKNIKGNLKKHDFFTIELKNFYPLNYTKRKEKYNFDLYFIIPENLFIIPPFFELNDFYKSFKNYFRFKTPILSSNQIVNKLKEIKNKIELYNTKNKSSQQQINDIKKVKDDFKIIVLSFCVLIKNKISSLKNIKDIKIISKRFHIFNKKIKNVLINLNSIRLINDKKSIKDLEQSILDSIEYILIYIEKFYIKLLEIILKDFNGAYSKIYKNDKLYYNNEKKFEKKTLIILEKEIIKNVKKLNKFRLELGIPVFSKKNSLINSANFLNRKAKLKKIFSSILFLDIKRASASFALEQIIFSIAAGFSMLLATIFTIYSQNKFGYPASISLNFTSIILLIIVLIYIMKDRLKDFLKFYLLVKLKKYIYNYNINIVDNNKKIIAKMKEGIWFFKSSQINKKRIKLYNFLKTSFMNQSDFDIIHYRKVIKIRNKLIKNFLQYYEIKGIDDIIRFSFQNFTSKMDDPEKDILILNEINKLEKVKTLKTYFIYLVVNYTYKKSSETDYYSIEINRNGIVEIKKLKI